MNTRTMEDEAKLGTGTAKSATDAKPAVLDQDHAHADTVAGPQTSLTTTTPRQPSGSIFYIHSANPSSSSSSNPSIAQRKSNANSRRSLPDVEEFVAGSSRDWQYEYDDFERRSRRSGSLRSVGSSGSEKVVNVEDVNVTEARRDGSMKTTDSEKAGAGYDMRESQYAYTFFSPEMASLRRQYCIIIARVVLLTILLMWACLPIYWSSLAHSATHTNNLTAWFINRDTGRIGAAIRQGIEAMPTSGRGSLGWVEIQPSNAGDDNEIIDAVVRGKTWIAVVVSVNASSLLSSARRNGDVNYDPNSAITVYYATARNEIATSTYLLPITQSMLRSATTSFATSSTQRYLATIVAQNGSVNTTALEAIARAPATIAPGVGWKEVDLRRYTAPVAQAVTLVGQIYICIFAFIVVMGHTYARTFVEPYLTFRSYLTIRVLCPMLAYIPLSLSYALVQLPFKLPFEAKFSFAGGLVLFFVYIYLGMCALGLALEAMITVLTPRFVPFFLVMLIIVNVSTAALPPELQPSLFQYGAGFPFWNIEQAVRTIIFDTYSHLGKNAGVLIAWILLSCCTLSVLVWYMRREIGAATKRSLNPGVARQTIGAEGGKIDKSGDA